MILACPQGTDVAIHPWVARLALLRAQSSCRANYIVGRKVWTVLLVQNASGSFDCAACKERKLLRSG